MYKVVNGTSYNSRTPAALVNLFEEARQKNRFVRFMYGDTNTGKDWLENYDVCGYIGRSTGSLKIPLILYRRYAMGGTAILDHCIVRLLVEGKEVWRHENYADPELVVRKAIMDGYSHEVMRDGTVIARFRTLKSAERWVAFMTGKRRRP